MSGCNESNECQSCFSSFRGIKAGWEQEPELRTRVVKRLKEVGDMAASEGLVIGIETQLDAKGDVRLLKEIDSPALKSILNFRMYWKTDVICARSSRFWGRRESARFIVRIRTE